MKTLILLFLLLTTPAYSYDLTQIPKYNFEETNKQYNAIADVIIEYAALNKVFFKLDEMGVKPDKKQDHEILLAIDIYLYWIAVAHIQLYNEDYINMAKSAKKASDGLAKFKSVLVVLVRAKST
jgi:hypothetical protein